MRPVKFTFLHTQLQDGAGCGSVQLLLRFDLLKAGPASVAHDGIWRGNGSRLHGII